MTTETLGATALVLLTVACGSVDHAGAAQLLAGTVAPPAEVADACALTARRCSRCHTIERVLQTNVTEPSAWEDYVHRMRLMPASGIPADEEAVITRCLTYRSFGDRGLAALHLEVPR